MKPDEIRNLAIECGAGENTHGEYILNSDELADYTAAVEAPLQARIAQLEEALTRIYGNGDVGGNSSWCDSHEDCQDAANYALNSSPSTWLSEHDKEVEARERARIIASHEFLQREGAWLADSIRNMK